MRERIGQPDTGWWVDSLPAEDAASVWALVAAHLCARLLPHRYDRLLVSGARPRPGTALAVHAERIASVREREAVARSLRRCLADAAVPDSMLCSRIPLHTDNIQSAEAVIDDITLWLHSPRAVSAHGVAGLRRILADGSGPLFAGGRGDLEARLRATLAEF